MAESVVNKVVNKVCFRIDKASWNNLNRFQKRFDNIKKQMKSFNKDVTANAKQAVKEQEAALKRIERANKKAYAGGSKRSMQLGGSSGGARRGNRGGLGIEAGMTYFQSMKNSRGEYQDWWNTALKDRDSFNTKMLNKEKEASKNISAVVRERMQSMTSPSGAGKASSYFLDEQVASQREQQRLKDLERFKTKREQLLDRIETRTLFANNKAGDLRLRKEQMDAFQNSLRRVNQEYAKGAISTRRYNEETRSLLEHTKRLSMANKGLIEKLTSIRMMMIGGIGFAGYETIRNIAHVGQTLEGVRASLLIVSQDAAEANKNFHFLAKTASETGTNLDTAARGFVSLGVNTKDFMNTQQLQDLFQAYSRYAVVSGANQMSIEKGIQALSQIAGKGQAYAEEVRQQLSEQIPGALKIFAKSLNLTTKELFNEMAAGNIMAKDVLPKLAKEFNRAANSNGAFQKMMNTNRIVASKLNTQFMLFRDLVFTSGLRDGLNYLFNSLMDLMDAGRPLAVLFGNTLATAISTIIFPFRLLAAVVLDLSDAIGINLNGSLTKFLGSFGGIILGAIALVKTFKLLSPILLAMAGTVLMLARRFIFLTVAILSNPIGAAITAIIAALAALGYFIYKNWDSIKSFFIGVWDSIVGVIDNSIKWITSKFQKLMGWVKKAASFLGFGSDDDVNIKVKGEGSMSNVGQLSSNANNLSQTGGYANRVSYIQGDNRSKDNKPIPLDINVNSGAVEGLVDVKVRENNDYLSSGNEAYQD